MVMFEGLTDVQSVCVTIAFVAVCWMLTKL